tara:strand:- start:24069 stop:24302 length:234 start_codon:yes stop_codon:yes gene_type:complete
MNVPSLEISHVKAGAKDGSELDAGLTRCHFRLAGNEVAKLLLLTGAPLSACSTRKRHCNTADSSKGADIIATVVESP